MDTSALLAIAKHEPEEEQFAEAMVRGGAIVGTPTLFETRLVLSSLMIDSADKFIEDLLRRPSIHPLAFSLPMYYLAIEAFDRFGKGRGHPAQLNFGDCMAYAVAKREDVPLLFKGEDFAKTDIRPALR